jgi:hypothetical protein
LKSFVVRQQSLILRLKKKAKADEISRLKNLGFQGVLEEIKPLKEIIYEPLILGDH